MKIVVDTNVLVSGVFFGGFPRRVLSAVADRKFIACATVEIIDEYEEIIQEMVEISKVKVSRDPDDDKFIGCAKDAKALYIVSGDKDLLVLGHYEDIEIVTAKEFCEKYLEE